MRVLKSKNNTISVALALELEGGEGRGQLTNVGSMLFTRGVSGTRAVLQKVASELHPKVRNHGEGPY